MLEGCRSLARAMSDDGPFFLGQEFSAFECAVAPFWQRYLWVGSVYRNLQFPSNEPAFHRLQQWWEAVAAHPSVAATLVCQPRLVSSYRDYAEAKGTSEYAKQILGETAVRVAQQAHVTRHSIKRYIAFAVGIALGVTLRRRR